MYEENHGFASSNGKNFSSLHTEKSEFRFSDNELLRILLR